MARPRLSISTAFLLLTIVGMAIVIARLWREVSPLRTEVRQLRNEVGRLSVEDRELVHAIGVRTDEERTWKWRVWVPEGKRMDAKLRWGNVPKEGLPQSMVSCSLGEGEQWLTLVARHDSDSNTWSAILETPEGAASTTIANDQHWFDWQGMAATGEGVFYQTIDVPEQKSWLVLRRIRAAKASGSTQIQKLDAPLPGFILWLEWQ